MSQIFTPLRYPGGKQRLTPFIEEILIANNLIGGHYVEPYAGGAGVAINLLLSGKVDHIHLNDSDFGIYAFWHSVLNRPEELCKRILSADMTIEEWRKRKEILKKCDRRRLFEIGFSVFYLNRCNRSGVLSAGVIGGLDQSGNYKMDARFSRNDLIRRIEAIALFRDRITISNYDAEYYIDNYLPNLPANTLVYFDPPYYEQGGNLYLNAYKKKDHERLSISIQNNVNHNWILSYDGVSDIIDLYDQRRHFLYNLKYSAAKSYYGKEVFIFGDNVEIPACSSLKHVNEGINNLITT